MYGANTSNSTPSASTSSGEISLSGECEVFLSFCEKDTRNGFTDLLHSGLRNTGIHTFVDDIKVDIGKVIFPTLVKTIESSKIYIPILSRNYASSKWCLSELAQIIKCSEEAKEDKMILPIFYDVDPSDVKYQSGSYEAAFRQHEKKMRVELQIAQSWREALTKVANLKGLVLKKETGGREGELVKLTVKTCLQFLNKSYLHVPKNLVGMENHITCLKELLKLESNEVHIVGIHGMGGLGKTTMAKIIYNQFCYRFEGHYFLANVREKSRPRGRIVNLQHQLISNIENKKFPKFDDFNEGSNIIKEVVRGRKLLIVLDDVDEKFQVDMLMGRENWFGAQSRIIITTRYKDVLDEIERDCQRGDLRYRYASYEPNLMNDPQSLQLFSNYAFKMAFPPQKYIDLSKDVVSIAAGLPLVIEVLGSTFSEVDGNLWEETVRKLREIPNREMLDKLRFSLEALKYGEKQIFLDIACHFIGSKVERPICMWDDCKFNSREGIIKLINRSLITISDDNTFEMSDQLRDLGRRIVREEGLNGLGKQSRFWCEEDAIQLLETSQEADCVTSICIPRDKDGYDSHYRPHIVSHFPNLPNLRYLSLKDYDLNAQFKYPLSSLRWLEWTGSGGFKPTNLQMTNLVILDLSNSDFTDDWEGWSQLKTGLKLKILDLSYSLRITVLPDLSAFVSLEMLILHSCDELRTLDGVHRLKSLKCLDASGCRNLETLPIISNLRNLVKIYLLYCSKIVDIQGLENLESLQDLDVHGCYSLRSLNCSKLANLEILCSSDCVELTSISGLGELKYLKFLSIAGCKSIEILPDLSNLENLESLDASGCVRLTVISGLEELKCLKILHVTGCNSLEMLPNLSKLENLRSLDASGCVKLAAISGLGELKSLKWLGIGRCELIKMLPNLSKLENLKDLDASGCVKLTAISGLEDLKSLEWLSIAGCESISTFPNISKLQNLKSLDVSGSVKLTLGLKEMKSEWLDIAGCESTEILPNLSKEENLKSLDASNMEGLDYEQEQIFLDIACLFIGMDKTRPLYMWDGCGLHPKEGISALASRSLISISDDNKLIMPNIHRDRGRKIVSGDSLKEVGRRSRLWCKQEARLALETHLGTGEIEALYLDFAAKDLKFHPRRLVGDVFANLPNLRFLVLGCVDLHGEFAGIFTNIKWLKWAPPGSFSPINLYVENLVILDLSYSKITDDWKGWSQIKMSKHLKVLDLSHCYSLSTTSHFSLFGTLEQLILSSCFGLVDINQSLGNLVNLRLLDLSNCLALRGTLNCENFAHLECLDVSGTKLQDLHGFKELKNLRSLNTSGCRFIVTLSDISSLKMLRRLDTSECVNLHEIQGLEKLNILQHLNMRGCLSMDRIDDISELKMLEEVNIAKCYKLHEVDSLGHLECLVTLDLSFCTSLQSIPNFSKFRRLKKLRMCGLTTLKDILDLGVLESLELLDVTGCKSIRKLGLLQDLKQLKEIYACRCVELVEIIGLEEVRSLELLDISGCESIEKLPALLNLERLKVVKASGCIKLSQIRGLEELKCLELLNIRGCDSLGYLSDLPNVKIDR